MIRGSEGTVSQLLRESYQFFRSQVLRRSGRPGAAPFSGAARFNCVGFAPNRAKLAARSPGISLRETPQMVFDLPHERNVVQSPRFFRCSGALPARTWQFSRGFVLTLGANLNDANRGAVCSQRKAMCQEWILLRLQVRKFSVISDPVDATSRELRSHLDRTAFRR